MNEPKEEFMRIADRIAQKHRCNSYELRLDIVTSLHNVTGGLKHDAAVATIGHDQLNRLISLFDGAGFRGMHVDKQAEAAVAELKELRRRAHLDEGQP